MDNRKEKTVLDQEETKKLLDIYIDRINTWEDMGKEIKQKIKEFYEKKIENNTKNG